MATERFLTLEELEAGLDTVRQSPADAGRLEMIVRRPDVGVRELLQRAELDVAGGLVGDNWRTRGSTRTADGAAHPDMQLTLMNARALALVAPDATRRPLTGDQLLVDLDLSRDNAPPGTRLAIGGAIIEITAQPHHGCKKFADRFGVDAMKFVNSPAGKALQLRGVNARVVQAGTIAVGDAIAKLAGEGYTIGEEA